MFEEGFPIYLQAELHTVLAHISTQTNNNVSIGCTEPMHKKMSILSDGSIIQFPYRIYFVDDDSLYAGLKQREEQLIYHCIFTRSCDGHIREKHLREILQTDYPQWCMPYILELSSEYVVEILELIYDSMRDRDNSLFQAFCQNNPCLFKYNHSRMISYWNEFYRKSWYRYHDYVGYKLYKDCFGYSKDIERKG